MLLLRSFMMITFTALLFFAGCGDSDDEKPQTGAGGAGGASAGGSGGGAPAGGNGGTAAGPLAEVRRVCVDGCTKLAGCYAEENPDLPPGTIDCQQICTDAAGGPSSGMACPNATTILAQARTCLTKGCDELEACLDAVPDCN